MGLLTQVPIASHQAEPSAGFAPGKRKMSRVLIVCDDGAHTDQLKRVFSGAGIASENTDNMSAGCNSALSGRFGVVFSTPESADGSWRRLIEVALQHGSNFEIVLLARSFDLNEWSEALQLGAFEVMDVLHDLPKAAEIARRALGTGYLQRNFSASKHDPS
jgi:DNA-binding NtrC family response regulator